MTDMFIEVRYPKARTMSALDFLDSLDLGLLTPKPKKPKTQPHVPLIQYEFLPPVPPKPAKKK